MPNYPIAASQGRHVSLTAVPKFLKNLFIDSTMIKEIRSPETQGTCEVVEISSAIEVLTSTANALKSICPHPRDLSMVVVDAKALHDLDVMLMRLPGRQAQLGDIEGSVQSRDEAGISSELANTIKPLATKIRAGSVSAEDVYQSLTKNPNPDAARKMLIGSLKSEALVMNDKDVLFNCEDEPMERVTVLARDPQELKIKVLQLDFEKQSVTAKLVGLNSKTEIFSITDPGKKYISLRVPDSDYFFLMNQAAAL